MNRQSVLAELSRHKDKLINVQKKRASDIADLTNVKSPIKRKKYSKGTSKARVQAYRDNLDNNSKAKKYISGKIRKQKMRADLDNNLRSKQNLCKKIQKQNVRKNKSINRNELFSKSRNESMVGPSILESPVF